jgi:beta-lactam-binding protein with PASTA domain
MKPVRWRIANAADFGKVVQQDPPAGSVAPAKSEISVQVAGPVRPCPASGGGTVQAPNKPSPPGRGSSRQSNGNRNNSDDHDD